MLNSSRPLDHRGVRVMDDFEPVLRPVPHPPPAKQQQNHPNPDTAGSTPGTTKNDDNNINTKGLSKKEDSGPLHAPAPLPRAVFFFTQRRRTLARDSIKRELQRIWVAMRKITRKKSDCQECKWKTKVKGKTGVSRVFKGVVLLCSSMH